jgi:hypothetical protein
MFSWVVKKKVSLEELIITAYSAIKIFEPSNFNSCSIIIYGYKIEINHE